MPCLTKNKPTTFFTLMSRREEASGYMNNQKMTQNAINLASQATRALTIGDWSRQDCEEFLDDLEKEFKKVNKELDTYPLVDCEPGVTRKMSSRGYSGIMMPGARYREKAGRGRRSRRPGQNS